MQALSVNHDPILSVVLSFFFKMKGTSHVVHMVKLCSRRGEFIVVIDVSGLCIKATDTFA